MSLPIAELLVKCLQEIGAGGKLSEDNQHSVVRDQIGVAEPDQRRDIQLLDRFRGRIRMAVGVCTEDDFVEFFLRQEFRSRALLDQPLFTDLKRGVGLQTLLSDSNPNSIQRVLILQEPFPRWITPDFRMDGTDHRVIRNNWCGLIGIRTEKVFRLRQSQLDPVAGRHEPHE